MYFQIIPPVEALRPYITRYVFVRAEGSTDIMTPPADDPHFVSGKHVQTLLPNYGGFVFVRNATVDVNGLLTDGLVLFGASQKPIAITTLSGWFEGMMLDFEPGGMHALLGMDMQQLAGRVMTAQTYGDRGLLQCDNLFKQPIGAMACDRDVNAEVARLIDAFFLGHLPYKEDRNYARMRRVIASCDDAKGDISTAEMASVACLSERQFLRVFRSYVGIPPKQFVRLRRFHKALQAMQQAAASGQPIDLMSVAISHGYYDLSHMALEFQQMGCVSPSHFRMLGIPLTADFSIFFA